MVGDFKKLDKLLGRLNRVASGEFRTAVQKQLAHEALNQVRLGFRQGRDPYGNPWLKPKLRAGAPLRDKGKLANSFSVQPEDDGFVISTAEVDKAKVHQFGATIRPKKAKALRFRSVAYRPTGRRGKTRRVYGPWIFAKKVTIPKRPMLPKPGDIGPIWADAFRAVVDVTWKRFWPK